MIYKQWKSGELVKVYWVLLRSCAWQWSRLSELQAVQEPSTSALSNIPEGPQRDAWILRACIRITTDLRDFINTDDPEISFVREQLARNELGYGIRPLEKLHNDNFAIICRGIRGNGNDVVIKVLTNTPLRRLRKLFLEMAQARKAVKDPSVVRIDEIFTTGADLEQRVVILSALAPKKTLGQVIEEESDLGQQARRQLRHEAVGTILKHLAQALDQLHALKAIIDVDKDAGIEHYVHVMGPLTPDNVFYDVETGRVQISLIGITNFFWHFFDPHTFYRIISPKSGVYLLPENLSADRYISAARASAPREQEQAQPVDDENRARLVQAADSYFLAMLGLELLEARRLFSCADPVPRLDPRKVLDDACRDPRNHHWTRDEQLVSLLDQMLDENCSKRPSMAQVVHRLGALEEPQRVLAKYSFRRCIQPGGTSVTVAPRGIEFSRRFYALFTGQSEKARDRFGKGPSDAHHAKLIDSLVSVLNYRLGSDPASVEPLLRHPGHRELARADYETFRDCFIATLRTEVAGDDELKDEEAAVLAAWEYLFDLVIERMSRSRDA